MSRKPVYNLLGFVLVKADFIHAGSKPVEKILFNVDGERYNEETHQLDIFFKVTLNYLEEKDSTFLFQAGYVINDLKWYEEIKGIRFSLLGAVVYPFIRNKIFEFTADSRIGFMLPITDLRTLDMNKGLLLTLKTDEQKWNLNH